MHAESSAHLRELLAADHRYVFTLIHKFRLDKAAGETDDAGAVGPLATSSSSPTRRTAASTTPWR